MDKTTNETIDYLSFNPIKACNVIYPVGSIFKAIDGVDPNVLYPSTTWSLIDDSSDNDIVNNYFNTTDLTVETANDGSKWVPLYIYDATAKALYTSYTEALQCKTLGKLSHLYLLQGNHELFKNNNGEYEFRLEYPALMTSAGLGKQRWRQKSNPLETYDTVTGYVPIEIDYTQNNWGGLSLHNVSITTNTTCLLSGSQASASWMYCIGPYKLNNDGIPGPTANVTGQILLYIRVPSLEKSNIVSNEKNLLTRLGCKFWRRLA